MCGAGIAYALAVSASACVAPPRAPGVTPEPSCTIPSSGAPASESLSVSTTSEVDPAKAPAPSNAAERFVFAQSYETLIDVDCDGHVYGGLARSWSIDATGTRVTVVLRDDARFWNGDRLGPRDVLDAWRAVGESANALAPLARHLADAATIVDDRTVIVSLPDTESLVLADPALAVFRRRASSRWPEGSGPYRPVDERTGAETGSRSLEMRPVVDAAGPRLVIRGRAADARDAIDAGVDLMLDAAPVESRYAATRPDLATLLLPWQRTYVIAFPSGSRVASVTAGQALPVDTTLAFRTSLARDAVLADARAAEPPFWGIDAEACTADSQTPATLATGRPPRRIAYQHGDEVARQLAERLVALDAGAIAAPMTSSDFARALRAGEESAYVVDLPRRSLEPCHDLAALHSSVPWLSRGRGAPGAIGSVVPLIDVRQHVIISRNRVPMIVDWDGTLRFGQAAGRE